jgi:HlyD family secretion protein
MTASSDIITDIRGDALAIPIQSVAVRTLGQLKKDETGGNGNVAIADDSASLGYKPDKDGFVEVVFVVEDENAVAKQVTTGIQSGTHIEIKAGLNDGDEIVVGNYRAISQDLRNGSQITVQNAMAKN